MWWALSKCLWVDEWKMNKQKALSYFLKRVNYCVGHEEKKITVMVDGQPEVSHPCVACGGITIQYQFWFMRSG